MFIIDDYYARFWYQSDEEFEQIRKIPINDRTNKNASDFTKQKLVIEDHVGYGVIFNKHTNIPITMSGLKQISPGVGRLMNRHYIFPESRNKTYADILSGMYVIRKLIMEPLMVTSQFDVHILSMPNRGTRNNFFNTFYKTHNDAWPNHWYKVDGYVQTGNGMSKSSWQNALSDNPNHQFNTLNHDQWLLLKDSAQT